jgi:predicted transcriptional regulator
MSKRIKYTSTHFNTPPKNIIKQTRENQNYAITRISNEKNKNSKKKEQRMKKM